MTRQKTPSFVTEIPLATSPAQEAVLLKRLDAARRVYNACLGEVMSRARAMRRAAGAMPAGLPKSAERQARNKAFKAVREAFGFGKYAMPAWAKP
jgi:putative transposase